MHPRPAETWDSMLPGPATRSNFGAADCSSSNLLAFAAGSSAVIVDPKSMQLISVLPMPSSPLSPAPFLTAVRWSSQPLPRHPSLDDPSHLRLAAGDRQGRIAIWDLRSRSILLWLHLDRPSKLAIQDLCWLRSNACLLAAIHGPSLLVLWNAASGRCLFKYDATPEYLSCVRRDPFDCRRFCALGLRGFLLSAVVVGEGDGDGDVSIQEHQIGGEVQKSERDSSVESTAPATAAFPNLYAKMCFSERWRDVVVVMFAKEIVVFDLRYGAALSSVELPRGCRKFMDLMIDPAVDLIYCVHVDGRLSIWKLKE